MYISSKIKWKYKNNKDYYIQKNDEYRKRNPLKRYLWSRRGRPKMLLEDYNKLVVEQGNKCAICGDISKIRLAIDHNHSNKKIRGLLCKDCNFGLGNFKDSKKNLTSAIKYLEKYD